MLSEAFFAMVESSLPCHSRMAMCVSRNLWERAQDAKTLMTASTAIDPMPLPTYQRWDDIPVDACIDLK